MAVAQPSNHSDGSARFRRSLRRKKRPVTFPMRNKGLFGEYEDVRIEVADG
jgi:hypothetical protein